LELYAENISAGLASSGTSGTRKIRRLLSARLSAIRAVTDKISEYHMTSRRIPKEFEWLLDNRYIAEREGRGAILMLRHAGRLPAPKKGYPKVFGLASALVEHENGAITGDSIAAFITGAQKAGAFSEKELWLFVVMLRAALVFKLHELSRNFLSVMAEYDGSRRGCFSAELELERIRGEGGSVPAELTEAAEKAALLHREYSELAENIFTSLRLLSNTDFRDLLHSLSMVENILGRDTAGIYPLMDEESRSQYRAIVSRLSRKLKCSEISVAEQAIMLSERSEDPRRRHVGYYLVARPLGKAPSGWIRPAYFISLSVTLLLLALLVRTIAGTGATLLLLIPLSDVAKNLCDTLALKLRRPTMLPRLELSDGIPPAAKTICVISVLLSSKDTAAKCASLLENYMLANRDAGPHLVFGILGDLRDSPSQNAEGDSEILSSVKSAITILNWKYGPRFFFFTRERTFNKTENRYMSWERKRGALIELSRLLLGKKSSLRVEEGDPELLNGTKFVITLDSDTRLTIGSASELVGTMLHPLNSPLVDNDRRVVKEGYALLQPRMSVDLGSASRSFFSRAYAGLGGTDPYGGTISDLYQDLFDEGSFTGKGIFDLSVFSQCLDDRLPDNLILSHDLLEGCYLRAGFVSDVELTDSFPHKVGSYFSRLHRWTRGDWQIIRWLFRKVPVRSGEKERNPLSPLSKWKIFDNLRRSLVPVLTFAALIWGSIFGGLWTAAAMAVAISLSGLALSTAVTLLGGGCELGCRYHSSIMYGLRGSAAQTAIQLMLLPYNAMVSLHAILTSLYRMIISKKNLLKWVTSEQADARSSDSISGMYSKMLVSVVWGAVGIVASDFVLARVLGVMWVLSPLVSALISRPARPEKPLSDDDRAFLRRQAALMWQYFESFIDEPNNFLPPDNWQEQPAVGLARKTSPTNIGLALLCCLAAYDLRLAGLDHALDMIEKILASMEKLRKWYGHLLNWYDTSTMKPLYPFIISSVDSGNLACCYVALIRGLESLDTPKASALASRTRELLDLMDFTPLYDRSRRLFYISLDVETNKPSEGWYDLLASEARQTSYYCIAKGIVDKKHWRRLGRALVQKNGYSGMASWTGSMFEYLMPSLLLPTYPNSLLYESLRFCVYCHKLRGRAFRIPWGISESAYFAFDRSLNYQYKAHGVQRLAFKRGMNRELVISPYSSYLAIEVEPAAAVKNLRRLRDLGLEGRYGLYEAADYTPKRLAAGRLKFEPVKCFMAHHVGMSLVACDNALNDRIMQRRFMSDACMAAFSELLQERTPVDAVTVRPSFRDVPEKPKRAPGNEWTAAHAGYDAFRPACHLLSNGSYSLVITNTGLSLSLADDIMLSRFDGSLCEGVSGIYFFIRKDGRLHSLTPAPFFDDDVRYSSEFDKRNLKLYSSFEGIRTSITVCVPLRDKAELREVKIKASSAFRGELVCYFEPVLSAPGDYSSHPAFSKLFIETGIETGTGSSGVIICRRPRSGNIRHCASFLCSEEGALFDTSREKALGRGGFSRIRRLSDRTGSFSAGPVLDPCVLVRVPLDIRDGEVKTIRFALAVAGNTERAVSAAERTLSSAAKQASSRPLGESPALGLSQSELGAALDFLREITFRPPGRRGTAEYILLNVRGQSELWKYGISGDLPMIALVCDADTSAETIHRTVKQHRLLTLGGVRCDLCLLFSDGDDYRRPVRTMAADLIRSTGGDNMIAAHGGIHLLDLTPSDPDFTLVAACASVFIGPKGELAGSAGTLPNKPAPLPALTSGKSPPAEREVRFGEDGSVSFDTGGSLPALAWSNILANRLQFGFVASDSGSGYMWWLNARENRINHCTNDPLAIEGDERIFLVTDGKAVSLFADDDRFPCTVSFGPGYAVWEKDLGPSKVRTTAFVPFDRPCRLMKVEYTGDSPAGIMYFTGLVLGDRPEMKRHVITAMEGGSVYAFNRFNTAFGSQLIMFSSRPAFSAFTCDRAKAISGRFDGTCGAGLDPCVAMRIPLEGGQAILVTAADKDGADMRKYLDLTEPDSFDRELEHTRRRWTELVTPVTIKTPVPELDRYINFWALYQVIACRIYARTSMYQFGGAYGFRDQLQDVCAALYADPEIAKKQILMAASHQFVEGDVQHWWHPGENDEPGKGVRTRCSDDLLWLPYTVCEYIEKTGDMGILDLQAPFIRSEPLGEDESERYEAPEKADETADIYEHCIRAIELVMRRGEGEHGLSLIGTGDWNDGFNLVGAEGRGESVWLTWFFAIVLRRFSPICKERGDPQRADVFIAYAGKLIEAAEKAWDGEWYRRGYYDSGAPLGSAESAECRIDSIAQSFSAFAGADGERSLKAVLSAVRFLVDREARLVRLFTPAFRDSRENPGYIKGYLEGVRENGGQYTHAAVWLAMGCLELGLVDEGFEILRMLLPSNHDPDIYRIEPYVLAADVYTAENHVGRGGWSWYTGSAAWYYRAACQSLLGIHIKAGTLVLEPRIPACWEGFAATVRFMDSVWNIEVVRGNTEELYVDGQKTDAGTPVPPGRHDVRLVLPRSPNRSAR
jgi:cyclic beta-1,2-glucan synthetase